MPLVRCASPHIALSEDALVDLCQRWEIDELHLAGSALTGPFRADSDVDFVAFASYRSRVYAPEGWTRKEACDELAALTRRRVDLVCARQIAASGNPYAIYNLLVAPGADRTAGLLWYLHRAALVLSRVGDVKVALGEPTKRAQLLPVFATLARTCDTEKRAAAWIERGIEGPWQDVRALLSEPLAAARERRPPIFPAGDDLARLATDVVRALPSIARVAQSLLAHPPAVDPAILERARGDAPHDAEPRPALAQCGALPTSPDEVMAACRSWGITRLVQRRDDERSDVAYAFASVNAPLYVAPRVIDPRASASFAQWGVTLACARSVVATGNARLIYNAFVRRAFTDAEVAAWRPREVPAPGMPEPPHVDVPAALILEGIGDMPRGERDRWR